MNEHEDDDLPLDKIFIDMEYDKFEESSESTSIRPKSEDNVDLVNQQLDEVENDKLIAKLQ